MLEVAVGSEEAVCHAVLRAVADFEDTDPTELPPLSEVITPDALETLFSHQVDGEAFTGRVSFEYHDVTVIVNGYSTLTVTVSETLAGHREGSAQRDS